MITTNNNNNIITIILLLYEFTNIKNFRISEINPKIKIFEKLHKTVRVYLENSGRYTQTVQKIKSLVKSIFCFSFINPKTNIIIETDASNLGYGGIFK